MSNEFKTCFLISFSFILFFLTATNFKEVKYLSCSKYKSGSSIEFNPLIFINDNSINWLSYLMPYDEFDFLEKVGVISIKDII